MRRKKAPSGNLKFATLFSLLVVGLIFLSLMLRLFLVVGASKFDGANSITVHVKQKEDSQVINFSPKNSSIFLLNLDDQISPKNFQIPTEASFAVEKVTGENLTSILAKKVFDFKDQKELNFMDFLRLFLYSNTVKEIDIREESISKKTDLTAANRIITSFFVDPAFLEEKQNIEIINATGVSGLGNRIGNVVGNMGGNVILVTTGDGEEESRVEYVTKTYTAKKLARILNFKLMETKKKGVPDVIIVIGKDSLSKLKF